MRGALGFSVLQFRSFFRSVFVSKILGFSVLVSVTVCGFCSVSLSVSEIGFSNLQFGNAAWCISGFSSIQKIRASTTSTTCTSSRILLAVSVLVKVYFGFAVFYYFSVRLCGF